MARLLASISLLVQVASGFSFSQSLLQQNHTTVPNHSFKVHIGFKENDAESSETNKPAWCRPGAAEELPSLHWLADDEYLASPFASCGASSDSAVHAPFIRRARIPERGGLSEANLEHGKQCITDLVPKVALLFLTQGPTPHELIWEKWLAQAAGLLPNLCMATAVCAGPGLASIADMQQACAAEGSDSAGSRSVLERQHLFTLYMHAPPDYPERQEDSFFYGRDRLFTPLFTRWGDHSTIEVVRRMLGAALEDPTNQRMVLLSESCVPLWAPTIVYQQLMHEQRSRINACVLPGRDQDVYRYSKRMAEGQNLAGRVERQFWRKNSQWFALLRSHVQLIASDKDVIATFALDCHTKFDPLLVDRHDRFCLEDEHYIGTLLAVHGLDHETDCIGAITYADWSRVPNKAHPYTYTEKELNIDLIKSMRKASQEDVDAATIVAQLSFHPLANYTAGDAVWHAPYANLRALSPEKPLFARKFPAETSATLMQLLSSNELAVLGSRR